MAVNTVKGGFSKTQDPAIGSEQYNKQFTGEHERREEKPRLQFEANGQNDTVLYQIMIILGITVVIFTAVGFGVSWYFLTLEQVTGKAT